MTTLVMSGTLSKSPLMYGLPADLAVVRAYGVSLDLSDGRTVKDFCSGLGTNLLGYNTMSPPPVYCAPSLPHYLEAETADKLANLLGHHVPGWTREGLGVRWCKTGSEATTMAVRLARAVTGREWIMTFENHYHGWGDWTISRTSPAWGIPEEKVRGSQGKVLWARVGDVSWWGDSDALEVINTNATDNNRIAAVIFEQPAIDPDPDWYPFLRKWCDDNGSLLIADETVTGLRYGLGGASGRYKIEPDLICLGKALGNGLPINVLIGRRDYMDWFAREDPVFCSSTFWGETSGLYAASWVLDHWTQRDVNYIWAIGKRLMDGLRESGWDVFGHGARSVLRFGSDVERAWFIHGMFERGILMNRPNFPCRAHTLADIEAVQLVAGQVRSEWNRVGEEEAGELMADKMPRVLFRGR